MGNARPPERRRTQSVEGFNVTVQQRSLKHNMPVEVFDISCHTPERGVPVNHDAPHGLREQKLKMSPY
jgi:hypothetical protein